MADWKKDEMNFAGPSCYDHISRDTFAAYAMCGLVMRVEELDKDPMIVARAAYVLADAMLKARDEKNA